MPLERKQALLLCLVVEGQEEKRKLWPCSAVRGGGIPQTTPLPSAPCSANAPGTAVPPVIQIARWLAHRRLISKAGSREGAGASAFPRASKDHGVSFGGPLPQGEQSAALLGSEGGEGDTRALSPTYWMCKSTWWTLIFIQEQILLREKEHVTMFHTEQPGSLEETCRSVPGSGPLFHQGPQMPCLLFLPLR